MKKFLSLLTALTICSVAANAQDSTSTKVTTESTSESRTVQPIKKSKDKNSEQKVRISEKKEHKIERWENASPEQKEKMRKHREMMESLTPEQKAAVKKEKDRHHQEMKKITGFDMPMHHHEEKPASRAPQDN